MKFKTLKPLMLLLLTTTVLMLLQPAYAFTFTNTGTQGTWDTGTYPNFSVDTGSTVETGRLNITINEPITITNSSGGLYGVNLYVDEIMGNRAEWYWLNGVMRFYYSLDVYNGDEHIYANFYIAQEKGIVLDSAQIKVGTQWTNAYKTTFGITGGPTSITNPVISLATLPINYVDTTEASYMVQFQRTNETNTKVIYSSWQHTFDTYFEVRDSFYFSENFTNSVDFWDGAQAKLYLGYDGVGHFDVQFQNMQVVEAPGTYDFSDNSPILQNDNWLQQFVDFFMNAGTFLFNVAAIFVSLIQVLIPYTEIIVFAYFIDAILTSIKNGSPQPIGDFFGWLWEKASDVIERITEIGQAIAEALPF